MQLCSLAIAVFCLGDFFTESAAQRQFCSYYGNTYLFCHYYCIWPGELSLMDISLKVMHRWLCNEFRQQNTRKFTLLHLKLKVAIRNNTAMISSGLIFVAYSNIVMKFLSHDSFMWGIPFQTGIFLVALLFCINKHNFSINIMNQHWWFWIILSCLQLMFKRYSETKLPDGLNQGVLSWSGFQVRVALLLFSFTL